MASNSTQTSINLQQPKFEHPTEKLITKLQQIKLRFQSNYYGNSDGRKYEIARNFNIRLSNIIFEVNTLTSKLNLAPKRGYLTIQSEIQQLEKDLNELI